VTTKALILDDDRPLMDRLQEFLRVVDAKIGLEKVLLFGSTAKEKRRKDSDIDLIVVSKSFSGLNTIERGKMLLENWSFIEELDLMMYTPKEFERVSKRLLVKEMIADALNLAPKNVKVSIRGRTC
jgi:predicted nucleotidyltransferase